MTMSESDALKKFRALEDSVKKADDRANAMRDTIVNIQNDANALRKRLDEHAWKVETLIRILSELLPEFSSKYEQSRNDS